jgi:hypothetical protein
MSNIKIDWVHSARRCSLAARFQIDLATYNDSANIRNVLYEIQDWCNDNKCGRRVSFDIFQFKNKKDLNFFLLRWS